jgi:hypothetical protein
MVLLFVRFAAVLAGTYIHAYYVSVSEIYHNPANNALEITMKIFIDDLELAIRKFENSEFGISGQDTEADTTERIEAYLSDKFQIQINDQAVAVHMIGYELENDAVLCYIEIEKVGDINHINIANSIICEIYEEQINLTHFQYKGQLRSLKTTKTAPAGTIDASAW